jgi:hypothetical protein
VPNGTFVTPVLTTTLFANAVPDEPRHATPTTAAKACATAVPIAREDLFGFPRAVAISDTATHEPLASFQTLIYDLFMISFLLMFKKAAIGMVF